MSGRATASASDGAQSVPPSGDSGAFHYEIGQLAAMADVHPTMLWVADERGRFVRLNKTWLDFRGRPIEQEQGDGWLAGVHPDDRAALWRALRDRFASRRPFELRYRFQRADGQYRVIVNAGAPWHREDGRFAGFVGSCLDVSDHLSVNRALRRSEELYRATVDGLQEGVIVVDEERRVVAMNHSAAAELGLPRAVIGEGIFAILARLSLFDVRGRPIPDAADAFRDALASGVPTELGPVGWSLGGAPMKWYLVSCRPLRSPGTNQIFGVVTSLADVTDLRDEVETVRKRAGHDPLTGLANRDELFERMRQMRHRQPRVGERMALAFCDLDGFKQINDQRGHAAGDEVLRVLAGRVRASVRSGDLVARVGGDEMVVVLDSVSDAGGAVTVAEKVRKAVRAPVVLADGIVSVGVSIGVTLVGVNEDPEASLQRADAALYQAKGLGRDRVVYVPAPPRVD